MEGSKHFGVRNLEVLEGGKKRFDSDVYNALDRLGFRLDEDEKVVLDKPKYLDYKAQSGKVDAEVVSLLTAPEELMDGAPAVVFRTEGKKGIQRMPVTSDWFKEDLEK